MHEVHFIDFGIAYHLLFKDGTYMRLTKNVMSLATRC